MLKWCEIKSSIECGNSRNIFSNNLEDIEILTECRTGMFAKCRRQSMDGLNVRYLR